MAEAVAEGPCEEPDERSGEDSVDEGRGELPPDKGRDRSPTVERAVGLALRAHRRVVGQSQRAYAAARGLSRSMLARAEVDASSMSLETVRRLLETTGFELLVAPVGGSPDEVEWDPFDLVASTRAGSRFPAHRRVKEATEGPVWWWYHEVLGSRGGARPIQPRWTTEGLVPPPGTRYGRPPKDTPPGERRWPY